jgi:hypothetical protein
MTRKPFKRFERVTGAALISDMDVHAEVSRDQPFRMAVRRQL